MQMALLVIRWTDDDTWWMVLDGFSLSKKKYISICIFQNYSFDGLKPSHVLCKKTKQQSLIIHFLN